MSARLKLLDARRARAAALLDLELPTDVTWSAAVPAGTAQLTPRSRPKQDGRSIPILMEEGAGIMITTPEREAVAER